jgi:uncharacterized protein YfaS (alpha-2-macroglobulin family)
VKQKEKKTLKGTEIFTLHLQPKDLQKIKFTGIKGKVGMTTIYNKPYLKKDIPDRDDLTIKRSYTVNSQPAGTFNRGDLVEIVLNYNILDKAPGGEYEIVDVLPAGLSYVDRPYIEGSKYRDYPSEVKGAKITFNVVKGSGKITYLARVVTPGEYTAQGTLLSNINSNIISILGKEDRVIIK